MIVPMLLGRMEIVLQYRLGNLISVITDPVKQVVALIQWWFSNLLKTCRVDKAYE